jgi:hypothetical protein
MNHLPKLFPGTRRTAGGIGTKLSRGGVAAQLKWEFYGKYCGPGHGDPTGCTPDDEVDAVCCKHDRCYSERGYFDCGCDRNLVTSMPSAIANTPSAAGKAAGSAAMAFFTVSPCLCEVCDPIFGLCVKIPMAGATKLHC